MEIKIDRLIRSSRRTYQLEIDPRGELTVRLPRRFSFKALEQLLQDKAAWIEKHRQKAREKAERTPPCTWDEGGTLLLLGAEYPIKTAPRQRKNAEFREDAFFLKTGLPNPKKALEQCLREEAAKILAPRLELLSRQGNFQYRRLGITGAKKRWGSCNSKGNISLSWRLIQTPLAVVDYVISHELMHLKIPNHSRRFWQELEKFYPQTREARRRLKEC